MVLAVSFIKSLARVAMPRVLNLAAVFKKYAHGINTLTISPPRAGKECSQQLRLELVRMLTTDA